MGKRSAKRGAKKSPRGDAGLITEKTGGESHAHTISHAHATL